MVAQSSCGVLIGETRITNFVDDTVIIVESPDVLKSFLLSISE